MVKTLGRSFAAFLLAATALIASAFGWVAIYSHIQQPGRDVAHYEAYATTASPYGSLLAGPPIFLSRVPLAARARPPRVCILLLARGARAALLGYLLDSRISNQDACLLVRWQSEPMTADWETLLPVLIHIQTNLDADLSLASLSTKDGLSPFHFHRIFRRTWARARNNTHKDCALNTLPSGS